LLNNQTYRVATILLLTGLLSACGFHLRESTTLPEKLQATALQGVAEFSDLDMAFKRSFRRAGYALVEQESAQTIIKINKNKFERRVLSVNASGDPNEYELSYNLKVTLLDSQGRELLPQQSIRQFRSYGYSPDIRLAKDAEELQLKKSMINDAVRQIMHRINVKMKN
jgi:LPS-assembly lipoprotein